MMISLLVTVPLAVGDSPKEDDHKRWAMTTQRHYTHLNRFSNIWHLNFFWVEQEGRKTQKEGGALHQKLAHSLTWQPVPVSTR